MKVKIKKLYEDSQIPKKMTEKAGAFDVFCHRVERDYKKNIYICYLGVAMTPPEGYRIALVPRSSLTKYSFVLGNHYGIGDGDFSGEYQLRFRPVPETGMGGAAFPPEFPYKKGDRIGQMFIEKVVDFEFETVDEIEKTERDEKGFGSTGK